MIARLAFAIALTAAVAGAVACAPQSDLPADADVCMRATHLFSSCGVVLPTLTNAPCTGAARLVAQCVVAHADDCDGLATLTQRLDQCVSDELDGGDMLEPPSDLPVPLADESSSSSSSSSSDGGAARDAGADATPAR